MTNRLFEFLDTSPDQENTLLNEIDVLEQHTHAVRHEFQRSRVAYAQAIRGETLDEHAIDEAFARQQQTLDQLKSAAKESLKRVHSSLRSDQRARAAGLLEWGPRVVMQHRKHARRLSVQQRPSYL